MLPYVSSHCTSTNKHCLLDYFKTREVNENKMLKLSVSVIRQ